MEGFLKPSASAPADPLTLLAFGEGRESLQRWAKWKVLTDRSVGGYSEASFDIVDGGGATDGDKVRPNCIVLRVEELPVRYMWLRDLGVVS